MTSRTDKNIAVRRSVLRKTAVGVAAAATAVTLAACGADDKGSGHGGHDSASSPSVSASQGEHNSADTAFAQQMIPHHRQAVEMADLADTRAASPQVKVLAGEIKKAQDPEIKTMSGWLKAWGEKAPAEGGHAGHDMHGGMAGMMSEQEMKDLEKSSGKAFDEAFLKMMIKHHEGAVTMAEEEQAKGRYQPAKDLAGEVITTQTAEISRMNKLLGTS